MRISIVFTVAAASLAAASALPTPAAATDKGHAVALCKKNPKCSVTNAGGGDVDIWVEGGGAVACPAKGPCVVTDHGPARTKGTANSGKINGIVSGTIAKTDPVNGGVPPKKTPPATTVKRDHRGETTVAQPEKFAGTRDGRDPGWGNYSNGKGSDAIVRDHRH